MKNSVIYKTAAQIRDWQREIRQAARKTIKEVFGKYGIDYVDCMPLYKILDYVPVIVPYTFEDDIILCRVTDITLDGDYLAFSLRSPEGFEDEAILEDIDGDGILKILDLVSEIEKDIAGGYLKVEVREVVIRERVPDAEDGDYAALAEADESVVEMMLRESETCRRMKVRGLLMDYRCGSEIEGLCRYEVRHSDNDICRPSTVETSVVVNNYGTFYTRTPLPVERGEWLNIVSWRVLGED